MTPPVVQSCTEVTQAEHPLKPSVHSHSLSRPHLVQPRPRRLPAIRHIAVLIPARNEAELLPRCLVSLAAARAALPPGISSDIIVVADSCTDNTAALAHAHVASSGRVLTTNAGAVGAARALAARCALDRAHPLDPAAIWLSNTDADTLVPPTWLLDQLRFAAAGAHAVAGIIDIDSFAGHAAHVPERFRLTYRLHPDGTHPHVHGANLGLRADAYLAVGGWSPLPTAEDHHLWSSLAAGGYDRRSPSSLRVLTSGRRVGRAPAGFADALAAHNHATPHA